MISCCVTSTELVWFWDELSIVEDDNKTSMAFWDDRSTLMIFEFPVDAVNWSGGVLMLFSSGCANF